MKSFRIWILLAYRCLAIGFFMVTFVLEQIALGQLETPSHSMHRLGVMQEFGIAECRWTGGFWSERQKASIEHSIPQMWETMSSDAKTQFFSNFQIACGERSGNHRGPSWNDGDFYKWIEAASMSLLLNPNESVAASLEKAVRIVQRTQRSDGYIHTPVQIRNKNGDSTAQPFSEPLQFELYNFGHLMTAACIHHQATGSRELLDVAIKAADYLDHFFHGQEQPHGRSAICPAHYMGLFQLARHTQNAKYATLAKFLIQQRDAVVDGSDDNQDRIPLREQSKITGHAVRANYLYAGVADLLLQEQDDQLQSTLDVLWNDLCEKKLYVTGACGALFDGASPDGSSAQKIIGRTHQAYGRDYQLPNSTAHNESCATIGGILWAWRMLQLTGETKYADVMETALYNGLLATVSLDGSRYFYTNTLRQLDSMPVELRWSRTRQPFISCFCCPPNIVRTILETQQYAYAKSNDSIMVQLYGDNRLKTKWIGNSDLVIEQRSQYPWRGDAELNVSVSSRFRWKLQLRIPGWAKQATIKVNGVQWEGNHLPGSYACIDRTWSDGDRVELNMPMEVRWIESHPLVEETRNQIAVQRGPLIYCMESCDLEPGKKLLNTRISLNPPAETSVSQLPEEIVGLKLNARYVDTKPWDTQLYRELQNDSSLITPITLVPYFVWGNRGASEMSVWIPY